MKKLLITTLLFLTLPVYAEEIKKQTNQNIKSEDNKAVINLQSDIRSKDAENKDIDQKQAVVRSWFCINNQTVYVIREDK